jgi:hypothetical protein
MAWLHSALTCVKGSAIENGVPCRGEIRRTYLANVVNPWVTVRHNADDLYMEKGHQKPSDTHRGEFG